MTNRKVEMCIFRERRLSDEGDATDQSAAQRKMNSRSVGVLASCFECGGLLSEESACCPSSLI